MRNKLSTFRTLGFMMVALMCGIFTGCKQMEEFSVNFKSVNAGYVVLDATVPTPTEVAYLCQKEELLPEDCVASFIFMDDAAVKTTFTKSGEQKLIADLEENTEYHLYLVARLSATEFSQVYSFTFSTGSFQFDQLATVVATLPQGFKMRITVPESVRKSTPGTAGSKAIRYNFSDLITYNYVRSYYGVDEYSSLINNYARFVTEDTTVEFSEENNYTQSTEDVNKDGKVDASDLEPIWQSMSPGEPVVFLAGEFEWMELPEEYQGPDAPPYFVDGWVYPAGWEAGYYLPMLDGKKYDAYKTKTKSVGLYDAVDLTTPIDEMWTGAFQKKLFRTQEPAKFNGTVEYDIEKITPVEVVLNLVPSEDVNFYCFCILSDADYGEMLELLGGREELLQWATASYVSMLLFPGGQIAGDAQVIVSEQQAILADTEYHLLITAMGDKLGLTQNFHHYTFNTPPKTRTSGPKIVVTPLQEESTPNAAVFNIKCTSTADNPVYKCYYGANYYRDWIYAINSGGTYLKYGQNAAFTKDEVAAINSEEGLTIRIPSIDGETTRLVVVGFNDENTPNDLNYENIDECPAVADITTPYYEAEVCGSYFDMVDILAGDWTMSATVIVGEERKEMSKNVKILSEYTDFPSTLPDEVYDIYHEHTKWTDAEIEGYYTEFVNNAKTFNEKRLRDQNKLMLLGWLDGGVEDAYQTMTPYDLFVSEKISTVDVPSIFNDFGPKVYIEVSQDALSNPKLTITADMICGSPIMNWIDPFYMAGRAERETNNTVFYYSGADGGYVAPLTFDVVYSEEDDKLTIMPIAIEEDALYYPNVIGQDSMTGTYLLNNPIVSEVVLTRGHNAKSESVARKAAGKSNVDPAARGLKVANKKMTRFAEPRKYKRVEVEMLTKDERHEKFDEYLRKKSVK